MKVKDLIKELKVKHTIVPMHKSNYVVVTDKSLLRERYKWKVERY